MTPQCDDCGRPARYHAAWKTPTMSAPAFAYACEDHRFEDMIPVEEPIEEYREHLPARGIVDAIDYIDNDEDDVDYEDQIGHSEEIDDEDERGSVDDEE
jgi:hypothetical protein